ncbi:hypothetical protein C7N43_34695 [Sphingobacteriales bacterium UPWRP_1]|nr:hypothetical protein C7N43_34695 [Sphingobacteriales bacterium UPWRP_1]
MLLQTGFLIPGVAGTPYCATQCCKYTVNVANYGSDADDDPYYLVGIQTDTGLKTFPGNAEPDMRNFVLLEDAINALGIGTFRVAPVQDDRIEISSEDNPNTLIGIRIRIEGQTHDILFHECNCHDVEVCEDGVEKCNFYLFRKFETSSNDKIRFKGIKFVNTTLNATQPIDTEDTQAIATFINTLPEAENKFTALYSNNTLTLQANALRYKPEYVVWEVETARFSGGTQKQDKQTFFVKTDCHSDCCCCCGGEGQAPCANKIGDGCNAPLEKALDGVCRQKCVPGRALVAGNWVAAGNAGQPVDCAGKCFGNLVPTAYGCQPPNQKATVCDLGFTIETNANEKVISIVFGSLGIFKPLAPILLGADGADVAAWLNTPETGLCPPGTGNCVTVTATPVPNSTLTKFVFTLSGVNIEVSGTKAPITVTKQYCGDDKYHSCVEPQGCTEQQLNLTCPYGKTFNINFARCVDNAAGSNCSNTSFVGAGVPCQEYRPTTTDEYERTKAALIAGKILVIQSQFNDVVVRWYATRGLATDYAGYATHLLIAEGKLPEWEAICYQTAAGKLKI